MYEQKRVLWVRSCNGFHNHMHYTCFSSTVYNPCMGEYSFSSTYHCRSNLTYLHPNHPLLNTSHQNLDRRKKSQLKIGGAMIVQCQGLQVYLHPVGPSKLHQCKTPAHCLLCPTPPLAHSQTTSLLSVPTGQCKGVEPHNSRTNS